MKKIAVLLPCYNEEITIEKVINDFKAVLPEAEIFVYDNNSKDKSVELAAKTGAIVRKEKKQGKGNVIRSMFRGIEADCYLMVDADDTYSPEHAREMCNLVFDGADMVIGDRLSSTYFTENKRLFHNSGNKLVRFMINRLFNNDVKDILTGYRAMSRTFVKSFPIISKGFEVETEMTVHALDNYFTVEQVKVDYRDRPLGSESKLNTFKDGARVLNTIFLLYRDYHPLPFFSFFAALLFICAAILVIPVLSTYFQTGLVPRFPTLIVAGFLAIASILSLYCGFILDSSGKKQKQLFLTQINLFKERQD